MTTIDEDYDPDLERSPTLSAYRDRYLCPDSLDERTGLPRVACACGQEIVRAATWKEVGPVVRAGACVAVPRALLSEAVVQIALRSDTSITPPGPRDRCRVVIDAPRGVVLGRPPRVPDHLVEDDVFFEEAFEPPHTFLLVFRDVVNESTRSSVQYATGCDVRARAVPSLEYDHLRAARAVRP